VQDTDIKASMLSIVVAQREDAIIDPGNFDITHIDTTKNLCEVVVPRFQINPNGTGTGYPTTITEYEHLELLIWAGDPMKKRTAWPGKWHNRYLPSPSRCTALPSRLMPSSISAGVCVAKLSRR
jgi:hypothetical protein